MNSCHYRELGPDVVLFSDTITRVLVGFVVRMFTG